MEHIESQVRETLRVLREKEKERLKQSGKPLRVVFAEEHPECQKCRDTRWVPILDRAGMKRMARCKCWGPRVANERINRWIPERFRDADLLIAEPQEWLELSLPLDIQDKVITGLKADPFKPISLMGPTGVGKTYLLCALAKEAILNGRNIFFTRMNVLVRAMKDDEYGHLPEERARELISQEQLQTDEWGRPSHLYIDEFDKVSGSKDTYTRIFDLVNLCYEYPARVSLFTTTNLNSDEFLEEWGAAMYRRIQEISPFVHMYRE